MAKILCLTSHDLDGPDYGAALRGRHILELLAHDGHEVQIVLASDYEPLIRRAGATLGGVKLAGKVLFRATAKHSLVSRLRHEFDPQFLDLQWCQASAADRQWLQTTAEQFDLVWIFGLPMANNFGLWRWPHSVLDVDDIPSGFYRTQLTAAPGLRKKLLALRQMVLWHRQEIKIQERFDAICVCSELDRRKLGGLDKFFVLPNGFAQPPRPPRRQPSSPPQIGFVGTFKYAPNCEGMRWFITKVWPLIRQALPLARLRLAGDASDAPAWQNLPNVDALGWVADMESEMSQWSLSVVPVFVGGGTRIKIAEAFSRQCPVVATSLGAYGYEVEDRRELLLADTAEMFARQCLQILNHPSIGQALAETAWRKFLENWTWEAQARRVSSIVGNVLAKPALPAGGPLAAPQT